MRLTPNTARDASIGTTLRDHEVQGLQLRVLPTVRAWYVYYRAPDGTQRRPRIGHMPGMSLAAARRAARELLMQVARGEDPSANKVAAKREATVGQLCDEYLRHCARRVQPNTLESYRYYVETWIRPAWRGRRVASIDQADANTLLHRLERTSGPSECNHVRTQIRAMWNRARDTFWMTPGDYVNPISGSHKAAEALRDRVATPQELASLFGVLARYRDDKPAHVAAIVTLFLSGARVSEVQDALVRHWKGDRLVLDKHKTRRHSGRAKTQHVHPYAATLIDALPTSKGPANSRLFGEILLRNFWRQVRAEAGCPDLRLLDARRTFASYGISDDASLSSVGQLLGHTDAGTTRRYAWVMEGRRAGLAHSIGGAILEAAGQSARPARRGFRALAR